MKLYVGNLSFNVTEEAFKEAFAVYGEITEAIIISDKFTKRSKGFGFVTFADEEAGKKALAEMNGKELDGRELKVSEAKPMTERR
ncbi:MAG: RNA-binding protein [Nanoarchaeota archaeon]|jgi:cold-inducible RNA-binding protein|nr:RNA-binding protein [Nanoarchaeota archaeon]